MIRMAALAVAGNLDEATIDGWAGQRITTVVGMSEGFTSSMVRLSVTVMAPEASSVVWLVALDTLAVGTWARRCWRTDRAAPTDGPFASRTDIARRGNREALLTGSLPSQKRFDLGGRYWI